MHNRLMSPFERNLSQESAPLCFPTSTPAGFHLPVVLVIGILLYLVYVWDDGLLDVSFAKLPMSTTAHDIIALRFYRW